MVLGVGVVGAGNMGTDHARTLHRYVAGAEVRLVADVDVARAQAAVPGVEGVPDGLALVRDPRVEAVVVASADATHAALVLECVRAGKPVLCEKPLAPTYAESVEVLREVDPEREHLVHLGFMRRFDPGYVAMREAMSSGRVGAPLGVHCISRGVASYPGTTSEMSVNASAIHEFDVVPWLLDSPVVAVSWQSFRTSSLVEGLQDPQLILLRTADGVLTTAETFLNARYGYDIRCEVVGETGAVSLLQPRELVVDAERVQATAYPADWRARFADAYRLELQAWVDTVSGRGTAKSLATARDGVAAAAVAEAVVTSMRRGGAWVDVAEVDPPVAALATTPLSPS